jgi:hypothetical protein
VSSTPTSTSQPWITYDPFTDGPGLDESRWAPLRTPTPDGSEWVYLEPTARTTVGDGTAEISVPVFERAHDTLQSPDNAKHLVLSTKPVAVPPGATVEFSVEMAAVKHGGSADDYRDGFATFNVFDLQTLLVFDLINTGTRTLAIYERMGVPGVVEGEDAFTATVDAPFADVTTEPGEFQRLGIVLDSARGTVRFTVDDVLLYFVPALPVIPTQLALGLGLMTAIRLQDASSSLRGQGMTGRWRNLRHRIH